VTDEQPKTTHAQKRRLEAQAANRKKLRAAQFIRRLKEIAVKAETADPTAIPAMRLQADIYTRLLGKCLPDLKAIEHSGEIIQRDISDQPLSQEQWEQQYTTQ
jgi:hypothetical protein